VRRFLAGGISGRNRVGAPIDVLPAINGSMKLAPLDRDTQVDVATAGVTVKLPSLAASRGRRITLARTVAGAAQTIDGDGALINGAATITLNTSGDSETLLAGLTEWRRT
jgi:hypothetical protein